MIVKEELASPLAHSCPERDFLLDLFQRSLTACAAALDLSRKHAANDDTPLLEAAAHFTAVRSALESHIHAHDCGELQI